MPDEFASQGRYCKLARIWLYEPKIKKPPTEKEIPQKLSLLSSIQWDFQFSGRKKKTDERSIAMPGPYFSGQQPSPCGHYYPDVLRLRDEKRQDGAFVRILDCSYCGRYEAPLDVQTLDSELRRQLDQTGFDIGTREDEISEVRRMELKRLSSKSKPRKG